MLTGGKMMFTFIDTEEDGVLLKYYVELDIGTYEYFNTRILSFLLLICVESTEIYFDSFL